MLPNLPNSPIKNSNLDYMLEYDIDFAEELVRFKRSIIIKDFFSEGHSFSYIDASILCCDTTICMLLPHFPNGTALSKELSSH